MNTKFVGYCRVSTQAQGRSGLGLHAQQSAIARYVDSVKGFLVNEFHEVESGGRSAERPNLALALSVCRKEKAVLVIAKLDRLARSVRFISQLLESDVEFVAADMPAANKLTIHIFAAMAEYERDAISERTRLSLQAAKARGARLGNPQLALVAAAGVEARIRHANEYALSIAPRLTALGRSGVTSYAAIARELASSGVATQRGGRWTAAGVRNIVSRLRLEI